MVPMVTATVLFQPGWSVTTVVTSGGEDPDTGELLPAQKQTVHGRGVVQAPLWTGFQETTSDGGIRDERLVMFSPVVEVGADAEFLSPSGQCWQAITDGMPRGIPGQVPEYVAVRVRRAKEKDHAS